MEFIFYL